MKQLSVKKLEINKKLKIWYLVPAIILVAALIVFFSVSLTSGWDKGLGYGADFTGGTMLTVKLADGAEGDKYDENVKVITDIIAGVENAPKIASVQKTVTEDETSAILIKYQNKAASTEEIEQTNKAISEAIAQRYDKTEDASFVKVEQFGKNVYQKFINKAVIAAAVVLVAVWLYALIRYGLWQSVTAAVIMVIDVAMLFALTVAVRMPINRTYFAVVLTAMILSAFNSLAVFAAVKTEKKQDDKGLLKAAGWAEKAVDSTLLRLLVTSGALIIGLVVLSVLGSTAMSQFGLTAVMAVGLTTYSAIFLTAPTWVAISETAAKNKAKTAVKKVEADNKAEVAPEVAVQASDTASADKPVANKPVNKQKGKQQQYKPPYKKNNKGKK